jgi:amidophosphoribosyltransferase
MGADSLGHLSLDALRTCAAALKHGFCDACFSDQYPVAIEDDAVPPQLSLFRSVGDDDA